MMNISDSDRDPSNVETLLIFGSRYLMLSCGLDALTKFRVVVGKIVGEDASMGVSCREFNSELDGEDGAVKSFAS